MEALLKRHLELLLERKMCKEVDRLRDNIRARDLRINISYSSEGKLTQPISLSGSCAMTILEPRQAIAAGGGQTVCDIFTGVYSSNQKVACGANSRPLRILRELRPDLRADGEQPGWGQLSEINFSSLLETVRGLRDKKAAENLQQIQLSYETFYQSTVLLFTASVITPYMLKLDIVRRLLVSKKIESAWCHLTEALEKSNHTSTNFYHAKSMRDGGRDGCNFSSDYGDIYHLYVRVIQSALDEDSTCSHSKLVEDFAKICQPDGPESYLQVVRNTSVPQLKLGKTTEGEQFYGMKFYVHGGFTKHKKEDIQQIILGMGGYIVAPDSVKKLHAYTKSMPFFVVIQDFTILEDRFCKSVTMKKTDTFLETTKGNWRYVSVAYILDCQASGTLSDPEPYTWKCPPQHEHKFGRGWYPMRTAQLTRQVTDSASKFLTAKSAIKRAHRNKKDREEPRAKVRNVSAALTTRPNAGSQATDLQ